MGNDKLLEILRPVANGSCSMCHLLSLNVSSLEAAQTGTYNLRHSFSNPNSQQMGLDSNSTSGSMTGSRFLVPQPEGANLIRIPKADAVDFELFKGWIRLCQDMHI
jgi:hypothetical protein